MKLVRERLSIQAVAGLYKRLADGDESVLLDKMTANRIAA